MNDLEWNDGIAVTRGQSAPTDENGRYRRVVTPGFRSRTWTVFYQQRPRPNTAHLEGWWTDSECIYRGTSFANAMDHTNKHYAALIRRNAWTRYLLSHDPPSGQWEDPQDRGF